MRSRPRILVRWGLVLACGLLACCLKDGPDPECGNGVVEPPEECDCGTGASPPAGCTMQNSMHPDADCRSDCRLPGCGDGVRDTGEDCDGPSLGDQTCESLGLGAGELACEVDCSLDTSDCASPLRSP